MIKILTGDCNEVIADPAITFSYEPDHFQKKSFIEINNDENILVTAHTGSGKTAIAKYAIAHYIKKGKKVIYTSPIKTLSNQKYSEFNDDFDTEVGLMTGDNKINPNADIVIMTTEILRNALYDDGREHVKDDYFDNDFISNLGCVIFDEVHYINDPDRGSVWEETINLLPREVTLVMLSATINNPEKFATWIADIKDRIVTIVPTNHRVIPLEHYIYVNNQKVKIMDASNFDSNSYQRSLRMVGEEKHKNQYLMNEMVRYLKNNNMFQTIIFTFSRKKCESFAKSVNVNLITHEERAEIEKIFNKYMLKYRDEYAQLGQYNDVLRLMEKGICYHHSGLLPILKEIIEIIFEKGLVKILFATETFAVGVNMPTRSVVFTSLNKFTNGKMRFLHSAEYKQMAGRAGRRGIDTKGYIFILPLYELPDTNTARLMLTGDPPELCSQFSLNYSFLLKIFLNKQSVSEFINNSLYKIDNNRSIKSIVRDINNIKEQLDSYPVIASENKSVIEELYKFIDKENEYADLGINVQLSKSDLKRKKKLLNIIRRDPELQQIYDNYAEYCKLINDYEYLNNILRVNTEYITEYSKIILQVLIKFGYINTEHEDCELIQDDCVTVKGIIASQINECNNMLLTEMLINDIFDELDVPEIICLLAVFISDNKQYNLEEPVINSLNMSINKLVAITKTYQDYEAELGLDSKDFWEISHEFVNIAYMWGSKCTVVELFTKYDIYEGNFIRAMLKLNNILNDLVGLSKILGRLQNIPKYETAQQIIVRDIVSVNSLYLS
jgi:superfamily II RNA helicase